MIYLSRIRGDQDMSSEDQIAAFIEQFSPSRSVEISGYISFLTDYYRICRQIIAHPEIDEEQRGIYREAEQLAGYDLEDNLDRLTEEYISEGRKKDAEKTPGSPTPLYIAGYQRGINCYTQTTFDLLNSSAFGEKANRTATNFYMAVGINLASELEDLLRDPDVYLSRIKNRTDGHERTDDEDL